MDKHDTLLLVGGTSENRRVLRVALENRYNLLEAINTQQMMVLMRQNESCIAAIILDITVPEKINREILKKEENRTMMEKFPVIVISSDDSPDVLNLYFDYGAADVIPLSYDSYAMLRRIENIVDLHLHKQHLEAMVEEQADILRHSNETMVDALSSIIEYRSVESGQHIRRIRHFTKILLKEVARSCPEYGLTDRAVSLISSAAALHDIGKIAIPDAILMKPGPLTQEERETMKTHSITGCQILDTLRDMSDPEYLRYAHNICHYHHERWDGSGYPEGISGEEIPICAQVVGLADAYDALTTKRVYKDAFSFTRAANMILRGDCGVFSPKLLECFKQVIDQYEGFARAYADGLAPNKEELDMSLPAPEEETGDSMERVRAKYYALIHYINGLLLEVDLDKNMFHLIYNPYPELSWIQDSTTLEELTLVLEDQLIPGKEKTKIMDWLQTELINFSKKNMRRMTHQICVSSRQNPSGEKFEITFLRIYSKENASRTMAVLLRKMENENRKGNVLAGDWTRENITFRCRLDENFTLVCLGDHLPTLAGYTSEELADIFENHLIGLIVPEDQDKVRNEIRRKLFHGTNGELEYRICRKDGKIQWVRNVFYQYSTPAGEEYLDCYLSDITGSKQEVDILQKKLSRYEIILAQTENVLFEWDCFSDSISFSDTWQSIFGLPPISNGFRQALVDGSYFHPDDLPLLIDMISNLENGSAYEMTEVRIATAKGRYLWCRFRASAIREKDGTLIRVAGVIINIDAEKQAQRLLQDRAQRDSLTKLLNKNAGRKQAEEYLRMFPNGTNCALLIIDLDNFKQVNDQYGHLFGDAVLTKVAREIERMFRNQDVVSRIGGDEFMVLMRGISDRGLLEGRCQRLLDAIMNALRSQQKKLPLSCSIGIALAPEDGTTYYELFNHADQALYWAKDSGKNTYAFYENKAEFRKVPESRKVKPIDSDQELGLAADNLVRYAFQRLYSSPDVEQSIGDIMTLVGKKINVSRVYIFENSDDNRFCSNTFEWCNDGISPEIQNLQDISYERDIPGYADNFNENGIFYCPDVALLKKEIYDIVAPQGIKSMLHCAIRENGVFRGYIGFDECVEQRLWTKEEIDTLTFLAETLSVFLLRLRRQEKVQRQANELTTILDNQDAWICIVDPKDYTLKYVNARLKEEIPDISTGIPCYKALKGWDTPCSYCPVAKMGQQKSAKYVKYNKKMDRKILLEATRINWENQEACLMTSRKLPEPEMHYE
ncbi:MAG: diguanylate cyclase [Oscillospiraceae bacterium]|nr:diguanylate cyclase [Oscillospiraceae bacterium]